MREFESRLLNILLGSWLILGVCFHLYTAAFGVLEAWMQRMVHLSWVFPVAFVCWPLSRRSPRDRVPWYDWLLALISLAPGIYGIVNSDMILFRVAQIDPVTDAQLALGIILVCTCCSGNIFRASCAATTSPCVKSSNRFS
jgi:TRAP-type uncharacterized transport system fused permease subunit